MIDPFLINRSLNLIVNSLVNKSAVELYLTVKGGVTVDAVRQVDIKQLARLVITSAVALRQRPSYLNWSILRSLIGNLDTWIEHTEGMYAQSIFTCRYWREYGRSLVACRRSGRFYLKKLRAFAEQQREYLAHVPIKSASVIVKEQRESAAVKRVFKRDVVIYTDKSKSALRSYRAIKGSEILFRELHLPVKES